jgi:DNA (cytosine-5)-methyltransferase 1
MIGIDLFSGAGGMSVGAMAAGVDICIAVEFDSHAAETYRANHPSVNLIQDDIRNVTNLSGYQFDDEVVVFGGPPCQGFSTSNQRNRSADNPNNWLFREFLRVVSEVKPAWVVFENVRGILEMEEAAFFHHVQKGLKNLGYTVATSILNAVDFGVPQKRSRLFIIGSRNGVEVEVPKPPKTSPVTVKAALADLPNLDNGASFDVGRYKRAPISDYARQMRGDREETYNHIVTRNADYILKRYAHIPPGGNWENIPDELMGNYTDKSRCHTGIYRRLKWNEPSVVIGNYRKNMLIHPSQDRGLSVREAARLQSFPDWFRFLGSIGFQQQQVGNAVPPVLAKAVFDAINAAKGMAREFEIAAE